MNHAVTYSTIVVALLLAACDGGAPGASTAPAEPTGQPTAAAAVPQFVTASASNRDEVARSVAATVTALQARMAEAPTPVATATPPVASIPAAQATVQAFFVKADPTSAAVLAQLASAMDQAQPTIQAAATQNANAEATRAVEAQTPKGQCEKWRGVGRRSSDEPQMSATILVTSVVSAQFSSFDPVSINTPCGMATLKNMRFADERDVGWGYESYAQRKALLLYEVEIVNRSFGELGLWTSATCVSRAGRTVSCDAGVTVGKTLRGFDGGTFAHEGVVSGWEVVSLSGLNDEGLAKVIIEVAHLGKIAILVSEQSP